MPILDTTRNSSGTFELDLAQDLVNEALAEKNKDKTLPQMLRAHGMDTDSLISKLSQMTEEGNENTRFRAIETGLKLNKALTNDDVKTAPVFIINISGENHSYSGVNQICIPREVELPQ